MSDAAQGGFALKQRFLRAEIVSAREVLATGGQDHYAHRIVGLSTAEGLVKLHQQRSRLGVLGFWPVEPDPCDTPLVESLVRHLLGRIASDWVGAGQIRASHSGPPRSLGKLRADCTLRCHRKRP
jgi:hypothetical protein